MPERDGGESRKKNRDGAWLNPKRRYNEQSAAKLRTGERSTTIPTGRGVGGKRLAAEAVGILRAG